MLRRELLKMSAAAFTGAGILEVSGLGRKECPCVCFADLSRDCLVYVCICPSAFGRSVNSDDFRIATGLVGRKYLDTCLPVEALEQRKAFIEKWIKIDSMKDLDEKCACGGTHVAGEFLPHGFMSSPRKHAIAAAAINWAVYSKTIEVPIFIPAYCVPLNCTCRPGAESCSACQRVGKYAYDHWYQKNKV